MIDRFLMHNFTVCAGDIKSIFNYFQSQITLLDDPVFKAIQPDVSIICNSPFMFYLLGNASNEVHVLKVRIFLF